MVFNIVSAARTWLLAMMINAENTIGLDSFQIVYFLSSIFKIVNNKHARTYARYTQIHILENTYVYLRSWIRCRDFGLAFSSQGRACRGTYP